MQTMIENIYDQPRALREMFAKREAFCDPWCAFLDFHPSIKKIYLVGSGTSYHVAMVIRAYMQTFLHIECHVAMPTVFTMYESIDPAHAYTKEEIVVVGISQSGTSYSTIHALAYAKKQGFATLCMSEDTHSLIIEYSDVILPLLCGKEGIPIETRGYSVSILTGLLLAIHGGKHIGVLKSFQAKQLLTKIETSLSMFETIIEESILWYNRNEESFLQMRKGAISGYGYNYMSALEASLKVYETFHQPIYGYEMEEMIHGYEMAFDKDQYVFMIAGAGEELSSLTKYQTFFEEIGVKQFVITCMSIDVRKQDLRFHVQPNVLLDPITYVIPFQILAAKNCINIGYDTSVYPHKRKSFSHKRD